MSRTTHTTRQQSHSPLDITDPLQEYEFEVIVDMPSPGNQQSSAGHYLLATKSCRTLDAIPAVGYHTPELYNLLTDLLTTRVVDTHEETDPELSECGVDITVMFQVDSTGHYQPIDVLVNDRSLSEYPISSGFWNISSRLIAILTEQAAGVTYSEVPY